MKRFLFLINILTMSAHEIAIKKLHERTKGNRSYGSAMYRASVLPIRELQIFSGPSGGGGGAIQRATLEQMHDKDEHQVADSEGAAVVPVAVNSGEVQKGRALVEKGVDRALLEGKQRGVAALRKAGIYPNSAQLREGRGNPPGPDGPYGGLHNSYRAEGVADAEAEKLAFSGEQLKAFFAKNAVEDLKDLPSVPRGTPRVARGARNHMPERGDTDLPRAPRDRFTKGYERDVATGLEHPQYVMGIPDSASQHWTQPAPEVMRNDMSPEGGPPAVEQVTAEEPALEAAAAEGLGDELAVAALL